MDKLFIFNNWHPPIFYNTKYLYPLQITGLSFQSLTVKVNSKNEKIIKKDLLSKILFNFNNELPKTETENQENYDMEKTLVIAITLPL